jgi:phosphoglycolate phosphatase-like HAD superfamily hydrolase
MTVATDVRGVILDVDGTLVDSNDAHAQAWVEALAEAGHEVPFGRVRRLIGMGGDNLLPELIGLEEDTPKGQRLSTRRGEIFKDRYLRTLRAFPGTRGLLDRMRADGLDLVVASSAQADELEALLDVAEAKELLEDTTSSGDVARSKPEPDAIGVALRKLGHSADLVMMLGDTPYDVEAAAKVGVRTVALRCGGWDDRDLDGVAAIYDDPADLLLHYDESPLARGRR